MNPFSDHTNVKFGLQMGQTETYGSPKSNDVWHLMLTARIG